ncbi:hypothetical protein NDN16_01900 [Aureimonas altamirensis]|uniref:hypothetical protein n=1 Tax=Aureimonas altamirensis TaxID=370622 RepID=UPI0020368889|nr:hypothetical protein [Aureimonas altamirensis]MCM2502421.1 hypothetical protein [Aureimonas altamirensis]
MRNEWTILSLVLCAGVLGLASGPAGAQGSGAPPPQMFPTPGEGDQVGLIAGLCGVQMKDMSPQACRCLAERSQTQLSDPQRDYLVATAVSPPVADRMLSDGRVSQPDQAAIFAFLNDTMRTCHGGTFDADAPPLPG